MHLGMMFQGHGNLDQEPDCLYWAQCFSLRYTLGPRASLLPQRHRIQMPLDLSGPSPITERNVGGFLKPWSRRIHKGLS